MECTRCEKELERHEIVHDYMGNEWCKECMNEEMKREVYEEEMEHYNRLQRLSDENYDFEYGDVKY